MTPAQVDLTQVNAPNLYEEDYLQWIETTVEKLRQDDCLPSFPGRHAERRLFTRIAP